jgi:hypothetical protein
MPTPRGKAEGGGRARWAARLVPLAGITAFVVFAVLLARFWHPVYGFTALYQLDAPNDERKIAAFRELPVYVHRDTGGYDGLYYAQIAHDPLLLGGEIPRAMEHPQYRARRILPPALAWVLGAGDPSRIILAYSLLNPAAWLILAILLWRVLRVQDLRGLVGWIGVMFSAGVLASVRLALTDLVGVALLTAAIAAHERRRTGAATLLLGAAALARETAVLGLASLIERPLLSRRNLGRAVAALLPLAAWTVYVSHQLGPGTAGWGNFTLPGAGLLGKATAATRDLFTVADTALAISTWLAFAGFLVQAAFLLRRPSFSDPWRRLGLLQLPLLLLLGTAVWEGHPGAATRVLLPLTVAFAVVAVRERAPLSWLVAGSLPVLAGLVALRDVPRDRAEIAAGRTGEQAAVLRLGTGWHAPEERGRTRWVWSSGEAHLTAEAWPRDRIGLRLTFELRSLRPRTVVLRADGVEIWRGAIGRERTVHHANVTVAGGAASLIFGTDAQADVESATPGARSLAFALYNPRLQPQPPPP